MKAVAAVVNRGPLEEDNDKVAEMIEKLEAAIENARELVKSLPGDREAAKTLNRLETRYNQIMKGRG
jgi:hypothetical protein